MMGAAYNVMRHFSSKFSEDFWRERQTLGKRIINKMENRI
jgi:hypothetical protein